MAHSLNTLLLFGYCSLIYWLSDQPSFLPILPFKAQDKIIHTAAYFMMGILAWRCFIFWVKAPLKTALLSFFFTIIFGLSDELHQSFIQGRVADLFDWYADALGAFLAAFMLYVRKRRHHPLKIIA